MNIGWYMNRLRAMSMSEIRWRLEQKRLERVEKRAFTKQNSQITDGVFYLGTEGLVFHTEKLPLDALCLLFDKRQGEIQLLGGYSYKEYKTKWHAGFQTENDWPLTFSYDLQYKQRDDIGDARTNWELNRHFQFALLARSYFEERNRTDIEELKRLFFDWNEKNPFLMGISWTSVMEVAIRDINWMVTLGFLEKAMGESTPEDVQACLKELCEGLRTGIINMTSYITAHYSRYSSANNHVIVEAAAIGMAGCLFACGEWFDIAVYILNYEIPRQNYRDGVNREMSLHYQSFFMEAVGLFALTIKQGGGHIPSRWRWMLAEMSHYLSDCQGKYGETVVFGDDDEGKILDLCGGRWNHYRYVLKLMGMLLPETLKYQNTGSVCYREGGVSLLKSRDGRALIGIDHGALGFGSIAAHGHADALSFQMYLDGRTVFADPGTYIYHIDLASRNLYRKTENHNTLLLNEKDQSQMLGAFLWGKRAECTLLADNLSDGGVEERVSSSGSLYIEAMQDGYKPEIHKRRFDFNGENELLITDTVLKVEKPITWQLSFVTGEAFSKVKLEVESEAELQKQVVETWISEKYGIQKKGKKLIFTGRTDCDIVIKTKISW